MKTRRILLVFLSVMACYAAKSQQKDIENIRNKYQEAKEYIKQQEDYNVKTRLEYSRIIPALGTCITTVDFYGTESLSEEEGTYPWKYDGERTLMFVSVIIECIHASSGSMEMEYLFDPESQILLFCYVRDYGYEKEYRYYFTDKKLIKYIEKSIYPDDNTLKTEKQDHFSVEEIESSKKIIRNSVEYLNLFDTLYSFEKLEHR
ncbi:MAG: hypothetical protein JXB49_22250 [Bacteroidales bacterium]|nr:hypothetical protein [Bacteroidales bacterium]